MKFKLSEWGTYIGGVTGIATYTALLTSTSVASSALDVGLDATTYLLGKGTGLLLGPYAEIAVTACGKVIQKTTTTTIQTYSPMVATAAAAVVGTGTTLLLTAGEAAFHKIRESLYRPEPIQTQESERGGEGEESLIEIVRVAAVQAVAQQPPAAPPKRKDV